RGIFAFIERLLGRDRPCDHRDGQRNRTHHASQQHASPPRMTDDGYRMTGSRKGLPFSDICHPSSVIYCFGATTRRPSLNFTCAGWYEPPSAPLCSGLIVTLTSSPGFRLLEVNPSRTCRPGAPPSRIQSLSTPSSPLTVTIRMVWGL